MPGVWLTKQCRSDVLSSRVGRTCHILRSVRPTGSTGTTLLQTRAWHSSMSKPAYDFHLLIYHRAVFSGSHELENYWGHIMCWQGHIVWTLKELQKNTYHCCGPKQLSMPYMLMCRRLWVWHVGEVHGRCWLVCCRGNQILCHRQHQVAAAPQ
jgi:hypothetical protein